MNEFIEEFVGKIKNKGPQNTEHRKIVFNELKKYLDAKQIEQLE